MERIQGFESASEFQLEDLPIFDKSIDIKRLVYETYDSKKIYSYAHKEFQNQFYQEDIRPIIETLVNAGDLRNPEEKDANTEYFKTLKRVRKAATAFGDIWTFVDESHVSPPILKKLTKELGDFKDGIIHLDPSTRKPKPLRKALSEFLEKGVPELNPASHSSFENKYQSYLNEIVAFYQAPELSLAEHHRLRRRIRTFVHYYKLISSSTGIKEIANLASFIKVACDEMGKTQDKIFVLEHDGKVDQGRDFTTINPTHKKIIGEFICLHK